MRKDHFLWLAFLSVFCCSSTGLFAQMGTTLLRGQFTHAANTKCVLYLDGFFGRIEQEFTTDSAGNFNLSIEIDQACEGFIDLPERRPIAVFVVPNDSLLVMADLNRLPQSIEYRNDQLGMNRCIEAMFSHYSSSVRRLQKHMEHPEPKAYAQQVEQEDAWLRLQADSVLHALHASPEARDFVLTTIKYRKAWALLQWQAVNQRPLPEALCFFNKPEYLDLTSQNRSVKAYERFLFNYYFVHSFVKMPSYTSVMQQMQDGTDAGAIAYFDFIRKHIEPTHAKSLYLGQAMGIAIGQIQAPERIDSLMRIFEACVESPIALQLAQQALAKKRVTRHPDIQLEQLAQLPLSGSVFAQMRHQAPSKTFYLYFWGTWCGGCISALPSTETLRQQLQGSSVEVVLIDCNSEKKTVDELWAKHQLSSFRFSLDKAQTKEVFGYLNLKGVPSRLIFDTKGQLIQSEARMPYSRLLANELRLISN